MNPLIENCSRENNFKLLIRRLTVESFDVFVSGSQFSYKMNSNLQRKWIAGGLFINTPTRSIHFKGKFIF